MSNHPCGGFRTWLWAIGLVILLLSLAAFATHNFSIGLLMLIGGGAMAVGSALH